MSMLLPSPPVPVLAPQNPSVSDSTGAAAPAIAPALARRKDLSLETLRGLAIILMVLGHVIGDTGVSGLRVPDDSLYRYWYFATQYVRMPLFTVLAGFVYAMRPLRFHGAKYFMLRKVERLYLPLLTVGTLQYLGHALIPAANTHPSLAGIWQLYLYGFDQFWFLHAIFLVFMTMVFIDGFQLIDRPIPWLISVAAASLLSLVGPRWPVLSFEGYLYLLPYFLFGCGMVRFRDLLFRRGVLLPVAALLAAGLVAQQLIWFGVLQFADERINPVSLCVGLTGTMLLFAYRRPVRWLAWCGRYSYGIFLLHVFPVAGSRILLTRLGVHNTFTLLAVGLVTGVLAPIVVERLIQNRPQLNRWLLGTRVAAA